MSWKIVKVNMIGDEETVEDGFETEEAAVERYEELMPPEKGFNLAVEEE